MEKWQQSELECVQYLKKTYGTTGIEFDHKGGSDSSQSDIQVLKNKKPLFYIEAKSAGAQCGQFVVLDEQGKFVYSPKNKIRPPSEYSNKFINIMQASYAKYKACGTSGTPFSSEFQTLEYEWVKDFYSRKKTEFIIAEKILGHTDDDNFLIFPLSKFENYFNISATYRVKTSGSNNPNSKDEKEILSTLTDNKFTVTKHGFEGGHYYIYTTGLQNKKQYRGTNYRWQFNLDSAGKYQVRKLSNTNNANVIFAISLKEGVVQDPSDLRAFKNKL